MPISHDEDPGADSAADASSSVPRTTSSLWGLLEVGGGLVCLASLAGYFAKAWWVAELCSHFRVQYAVILGLGAVLLLIGRRVKSSVLLGLLALVNVVQFAPVYVGADERPLERRTWRALLLNVHTANRDHQQVLDLIEWEQPDLVVLQEVNERWAASLRPLKAAYPHDCWQVREDNFGIGFLSRLPLDEVEVQWIGTARVPTVVARLRLEGRDLTVVGTHPLPPQRQRLALLRDDQLSQMADFVRAQEGEVLLLGDLNTSPWGPAFDLLLEDTDLRDSRKGHGVQATWPGAWPLLAIPLDHCLVSSGLVVHARRLGAPVGSDHLPVVVDFSVRP